MINEIKEMYSCVIVKKLNTFLPSVLKKYNAFDGFKNDAPEVSYFKQIPKNSCYEILIHHGLMPDATMK